MTYDYKILDRINHTGSVGLADIKKRLYPSRISPEMAIRLSIAFKTSAESWINQQAKYDLWLAEKNRGQLKVKCLVNHAA